MKITISNEIIDRISEDGTVVSRIPKTNQYLYLDKDSILEQGRYSVVADIDPDSLYIYGSNDPTKPGAKMRGETLLQHYEYDKQYDPQEQATRKQSNQEKQMQQGNQVEQQSQSTARQQQLQQGNQAVQPVLQYPDASQKYSKEQFRQLKLGQKHHIDISNYWDIRLSAEQMKQLRLMQENAVDIQKLGYNHPSVPAEVLVELRTGHKAGYDMSKYDWRNMSAKQLTQIRIGLEHNVDVSKYAFRAYSDTQMKQLRLGLQNGLDITLYRNPRFTDKQMYTMRCNQLFEKIKAKLKELFESVKQFFRESSLMQIRAKVMDKVSQGLDKTVEVLSREEMVQGAFRNQPVPEVTLDDRINETVQDIKELLVAQELIPEEVLYNKDISEQMNQRIQQALDKLMQPENIQNVDNQEQIVEETAKFILQDTGALMPEQIEIQKTQVQDLTAEQNEWAGMTDREIMDAIGEEMAQETVMSQEELQKMADEAMLESQMQDMVMEM